MSLMIVWAISFMLCGCAQTIGLTRDTDSAALCYLKNANTDSSTNELMASAISLAISQNQNYQLIQSCENSNDKPMFNFRPLHLRHPTRTDYILSPILSVGSIAATIGLWQIGWVWPPFTFEPVSQYKYEVWCDSSWAKNPQAIESINYSSYFGNESSRNNDLKQLVASQIFGYFGRHLKRKDHQANSQIDSSRVQNQTK